VTYRTAKAQVEKLAGLGILAPANGKRRGKVYLAQSILAAPEERGEDYNKRSPTPAGIDWTEGK